MYYCSRITVTVIFTASYDTVTIGLLSHCYSLVFSRATTVSCTTVPASLFPMLLLLLIFFHIVIFAFALSIRFSSVIAVYVSCTPPPPPPFLSPYATVTVGLYLSHCYSLVFSPC